MPLRIRQHIQYGPKVARQEPALKRRKVTVSSFVWTPERDEALRSLWYTTDRKSICRKLGCAPQTMYVRADRLGLPKQEKHNGHRPKVTLVCVV